MKRFLLTGYASLILCAVLIAVMLISYFLTRPKVAYVDINRVNNEFRLRKELEQKIFNIQSVQKHLLDSLELELRVMANNNTIQQSRLFEQKKNEYLSRKQSFEESNESIVENYRQQVIKQLNQYCQDYGKKEGYTFLYGADGSGFLMYADEKNDVTTDVIRYINNRYKDTE